jgi:hypothetical protein
VNTICTSAGGTMVKGFDFLYRGDYLSLGWVGDVMPLTKTYGELYIQPHDGLDKSMV